MRPRPDPIPQLKQQMAAEVARLLGDCPAHDAAALMRTDARRVMEIRRGQLGRFSLETLIRFVERLGREVELRTGPPMLRRIQRDHATVRARTIGG